MAVLFVIGAACFTVGGIVTQWSSVSRPAIGYVFFVGSIFFTTAAALQYAESLASGRRIDRLSSLVQLAGTILFNISTFAALKHNLTHPSGERTSVGARRLRLDRVPRVERDGVLRRAKSLVVL